MRERDAGVRVGAQGSGLGASDLGARGSGKQPSDGCFGVLSCLKALPDPEPRSRTPVDPTPEAELQSADAAPSFPPRVPPGYDGCWSIRLSWPSAELQAISLPAQRPARRSTRSRLVRPADALGAADARRKRPRPDSTCSSGSTTSAASTPMLPRSALAESSRHLSDRGAAAPPQRVARAVRPLGPARARMPRSRHARRGSHGICTARARLSTRRASRLDRGHECRQPAAALGQPRSLGHVRARALQLRLHEPGPPRDRREIQGGRHLCESLGTAGGRLLLRSLPAELSRRHRRGAAAHDRSPRFAAPAIPRVEEGATDGALAEWDQTVRAGNPEARFIPNGPPDLKTAGELAAIQFTDNQARRGLTPPWANGRRAKEYPAVMGRKPIGGIFSVGLEEPYRWKDSVQSEPEIRLWVAEGTANGMRPWVTKFSGVLYDRRWLPVVERIYQWHFDHERYLRNEAPLARVALLHPQTTLTTPAWRRATAPRITCSACTTRSSKRACHSSSCTKPS